MSLKYALDLLKLAHENIKIGDGPNHKGKHALILEKDCLVLTINTGNNFKNFLLDEKDLLKNPQDLIIEIISFLDNKLLSNLDSKGMN